MNKSSLWIHDPCYTQQANLMSFCHKNVNPSKIYWIGFEFNTILSIQSSTEHNFECDSFNVEHYHIPDSHHFSHHLLDYIGKYCILATFSLCV